MATTATLITLAAQAFPFIGIGVSAAQLITPIPSAEVVFNTPAAGLPITVASAGEDQALQVNCNLSRTFCYVLVEAFMRIDGIDANAWDKGAAATLFDSASVPTNMITTVMTNLELAHANSASQIRVYQLTAPPQKLIVPTGPDDAKFQVNVQNTTIDDGVGVCFFYARFLRYDRNQAQYWQVNTPVLVR